MKYSKHALIRKQQRGFQEDDVDLILKFGTCTRRPGNVYEYRMDQKNEKHIVQALNRIKGKSVLVNDDQTRIITLYINKRI